MEIVRKLRQFYTASWLGTACLAQSGSTYTLRMPQACYGDTIAGLLRYRDRVAMKGNLTARYGIREIEA